jgi:hypothetical protein
MQSAKDLSTNTTDQIGHIYLKKGMNMPTTIILAGRDVPLQEPSFAQLKRLLPASNRVAYAMATGRLDDAAMDDMSTVLSVGTGMPQDEIDALPIKGHELALAIAAITNMAGIGPKEEGLKPGEGTAPAGDGNLHEGQP